MKKKIIIVTILLSLIIFVGYRYCNRVRLLYKINWKIENMPNSQKIDYLIDFCGAGDIKEYHIIQYKPKDTDYIINNVDVFKKMSKSKLEKIYNNVLINYFIRYLNEEELKIFKDTFLIEELSSKDNYYALLERQSKIRGYVFELLILDTKNNQMHTIHCNYGD